MATDPLVINDGSADITYSLVSLGDNEALYRDEDSTLVEPRTVRISHQVAKTASGTDRHLVQLARVDADDDDAETPYSGVCHVVIQLPRKAVASADLQKEWVKLHTYVTANFTDIIGGFIP